MVRIRIKSNLFRLVVIALSIFGAFVLAERQQRLSVEARGQLIRASLESKFQDRYLPLPPFPGKMLGSKDIFIRDSSILRNNLPELPEGRFILVDRAAIEDSAIRAGQFYYFQLSQLNQYPDSATIVWGSSSGILSHKFNRVFHDTYREDWFKYRRTPSGWIGGLSHTVHYMGLRVL